MRSDGLEKRLARQEQRILDMLLTGEEVTNAQLATVSLKYFTKITNLRTKGYRIVKTFEDEETGLAKYQLTEPLPRLTSYDVDMQIEIPGEPRRAITLRVDAVSELSAKYRAQHGMIRRHVTEVREVAAPGRLF